SLGPGDGSPGPLPAGIHPKCSERALSESPTREDLTKIQGNREMSEDRSRGMYHSLIGKSSLRVVLVMGLLIGLCSLLLLAACGGKESAKGGADQEHNKKEIG